MDKIEIYKTPDGNTAISVKLENETVWLSQAQMAELFDTDRTSILRHIKNIYATGELSETSTCAIFAQVREEGKRTITRKIPFYNLDVIISVGYRVNSIRGTQFRIWANKILKDYIVKGYATNVRRLEELQQTIKIIRRAENMLDAAQVLSVVESYTHALTLLDDYDHQRVFKPEGNKTTYQLDIQECRKFISSMKFASESELFGNEKDGSFAGSIGAIYQTFGGEDLYPTVQEKAANLLYFITKNHSFSDGNKRIAAAMFLYFLDKNNCLLRNGEKIISDNTLVALTIMIAESKPDEKEIMVNIIMQFLTE